MNANSFFTTLIFSSKLCFSKFGRGSILRQDQEFTPQTITFHVTMVLLLFVVASLLIVMMIMMAMTTRSYQRNCHLWWSPFIWLWLWMWSESSVFKSISCYNVRKTLRPMEWFQGERQFYFCKFAKWQGLHWCDLGLWGWPANGGTQSYPGFIKSILSEYTSEEQTSPPTDLPQRVSV